MMEEEYYKILEIDKTATAAEIKKAYRKIAIKYHPDRNPGNKEAEEKFKKAAEAYSVLSDEEKRRRYDQFGKAGVDGQGGFGGFNGSNMNMDDIFSMFGDIFGGHGGFGGFSGFGGFGGFGGSQETYRHQGRDYQIHVKLTLEEIASGVDKKFKVKKEVACPECGGNGCEHGHSPETCAQCHGSGYVIETRNTIFGVTQTQQPCPHCHGEGKVIKHPCSHCKGQGIVSGEEIVEVNIPAGVAAGMVMNLRGKGGAAVHNGVNGDLQVVIDEIGNENLLRDGQDLIYNLVLSVPQATLGTAVDIPTIDGKARINIKAGTQPGTTLRLRGKGLPAVNGYGYGKGDIIVNVCVYIPESLSKEEEKSFEKMKDSDNVKCPTGIRERIIKAFRSYFQN